MTRWLLLCCLLFGALHGCKKDQSFDTESEKQSDDDDKRKRKKKAQQKEEKEAEEGSIPPPKPGQVPSLSLGSWAEYRILDAQGQPSGKIKWSTVDSRAGKEYLVEADAQMQLAFIAQAWVEVGDLHDRKSIQLKELKAKIGGGPPQTFPVGPKSPVGSIFDTFLASSQPAKWEGLPQEDVEVPAGTFKSCYKWTQTTTAFGITATSTIYSHPAVPVPAMVKSVSKDSTFELVAHGDSGAKPSF